MGSGELALLAVALSTLVERLVEAFAVPIKQLKGYPVVVFAAGVSILLCFGLGVDILSLLGFDGAYVPWVGKVVSGLVISLGSNVIHSLAKPLVKI